VKGYRQKEDPWNAIISGFMTGGALAFRGELSGTLIPTVPRAGGSGEGRLGALGGFLRHSQRVERA